MTAAREPDLERLMQDASIRPAMDVAAVRTPKTDARIASSTDTVLATSGPRGRLLALFCVMPKKSRAYMLFDQQYLAAIDSVVQR